MTLTICCYKLGQLVTRRAVCVDPTLMVLRRPQSDRMWVHIRGYRPSHNSLPSFAYKFRRHTLKVDGNT